MPLARPLTSKNNDACEEEKDSTGDDKQIVGTIAKEPQQQEPLLEREQVKENIVSGYDDMLGYNGKDEVPRRVVCLSRVLLTSSQEE